MRAFVKKEFIDKENGRYHRRKDVITISQRRYEELKDIFLTEVKPSTKLRGNGNNKTKR